MASSSIDQDAFPPGTILLQDKQSGSSEIILSPKPSDDPDDPLNWTPARKGVNFALTCSYVFWTFVLIDINYLAYRAYIAELGLTYRTFNLASGCSLLGLAIGCLLFVPCVHKFGRRPIYLASAIVQFCAAVWWANYHSAGELMGVSLLAGLAGSISEAIVMITIVDLFFVHQHARFNGVFVFMQSLGTTGGPIVCGYIIDGIGWRWMWWLVAIFLGINFFLVLFFFEESKYIPPSWGQSVSTASDTPPLQTESDSTKSADADADRDTKTPSSPTTTSIANPLHSGPSRKSYRQRLAFVTKTPGSIFPHFYQPLIIFATFPAVTYAATAYGTILAFFSASSSAGSYFFIYPPYNFSPSAIGLFQLGSFIGSTIGMITMPWLIDWLIIKLARRNGGMFEPEMRLWMSIPAAGINCAAMLLYGYGLGRGWHWAILAFAMGLFGLGYLIAADVALTYLSDSYPEILADALIAVVFIRNGFAAIIRFSFTDWLEGMGIEHTFLLIGLIALVSVVVPILLLVFGKRARVRTAERYRFYAKRQVVQRGFKG